MTSSRLFLAGATLAVACAAHAEKLNVKTGLWEVTTVTQSKGVPPLPKELLDRMGPEQRKKMDADIRAAQGKPDKKTEKECITQDDIDKPFASSNPKECKETIVSSTRTSQHISLVCTGNPPGSGSFKVSASSPESMTGVLDLKIGQGAETMTINASMQGRWLDSDCGGEAEQDDASEDEDATAEP